MGTHLTFMTENNTLLSKNFRVVRQDTHGNEFSVKEKLSEKDADALVEEYSKKPHHQGYWKQKMSIPLKNPSL